MTHFWFILDAHVTLESLRTPSLHPNSLDDDALGWQFVALHFPLSTRGDPPSWESVFSWPPTEITIV